MRGLELVKEDVLGTAATRISGTCLQAFRASNALLIALRRSSWATGLHRKSVAPRFIAATIFRVEDAPDTMITGMSGAISRMACNVSMPSHWGIIKSSSTAEMSVLEERRQLITSS